MTQSLVFSMQLDEAKRIEQTLEESWQLDHRQAMRASDMDYLVAHCLRMVEMLDWVWQVTCREAVAGKFQLHEKWGEEVKAIWAEEMQKVFNAALASARQAWEIAVQFAAETGYSVGGLDELDSSIKNYERKRDNYLFRLSLLDKGLVEEARSEQALGHYPTVAAALADLLAARHAERITPPYSALKQWADRSPAPASWQNETDTYE